MECLSFCLEDKLNLHLIETKISKQNRFHSERFREVLYLKEKGFNRECFIFINGTVVTWNYKRYQAKKLLQEILLMPEFEKLKIITDEFSYSFGEKIELYPHEYFNVDCLQLDSDEYMVKLAISYGLSTSIKLNFHESKIDKLIAKYVPILDKAHQYGKFRISRKKINKILSEIVSTKNQINLSREILYQPKFFWRHPNLEEYYLILANYLDLQTRIEIINSQLESLNETFQLFNSYLVNQHSHNLEIIIIILIAVEVVFFVLNIHL